MWTDIYTPVFTHRQLICKNEKGSTLTILFDICENIVEVKIGNRNYKKGSKAKDGIIDHFTLCTIGNGRGNGLYYAISRTDGSTQTQYLLAELRPD